MSWTLLWSDFITFIYLSPCRYLETDQPSISSLNNNTKKMTMQSKLHHQKEINKVDCFQFSCNFLLVNVSSSMATVTDEATQVAGRVMRAIRAEPYH